MTDEELDQARAKEASRLFRTLPFGAGCPAEIAARLAREGWVPVDPLVLEAREICAKILESHNCPKMGSEYRSGDWDQAVEMMIAVTALKRGIEIGRAEYMHPSIDTALQEEGPQ